jgi:DNA-binding YbaB/EbfC family protein
MKDLMGLMKQAQAMQQQMAEAQEKLAQTEVHGEAGAGLVRVVLTAKGDARSVSIDPSLLKAEEAVMVEDLILAAHNDARRKAEVLQQEIMSEAAGGLQLPPGLATPS